jgi:hypothetical protein
MRNGSYDSLARSDMLQRNDDVRRRRRSLNDRGNQNRNLSKNTRIPRPERERSLAGAPSCLKDRGHCYENMRPRRAMNTYARTEPLRQNDNQRTSLDTVMVSILSECSPSCTRRSERAKKENNEGFFRDKGMRKCIHSGDHSHTTTV